MNSGNNNIAIMSLGSVAVEDPRNQLLTSTYFGRFMTLRRLLNVLSFRKHGGRWPFSVR